MVKIGIVLRYSNIEKGRDILYLGENLRRTVQKAGGFVVPIVQVQDVNYYSTHYVDFKELSELEKNMIDEYLDIVDGVIFPGGKKITPFDKYVLNRCVELDKKVLGICLGMQLISSYNSNFITYENTSNIIHNLGDNDNVLVHEVKITKGTKLYEIIGSEKILVNSFHNRHVTELDNSLVISAVSDDGYIEGVELKNKTFIVGVQWHPEISYDFDDNSKKIIDKFINMCKE